MNLYIDGNFVSAFSGITSPQSYSGYWKIGGNSLGGWPNTSNAYFTGNIGMVHVYNRAITAAEVAENFSQTRGRFGV